MSNNYEWRINFYIYIAISIFLSFILQFQLINFFEYLLFCFVIIWILISIAIRLLREETRARDLDKQLLRLKKMIKNERGRIGCIYDILFIPSALKRLKGRLEECDEK